MSSENTLRTLKDLKSHQIATFKCVEFDELKAEAIKWVKAHRNSQDNKEHNEGSLEVNLWIKHFFNISETELENA